MRLRRRLTRRQLRVALGAIWLIDGALQLQPYMFVHGSDGFLGPVAQNTMGPPSAVTDFLRATTRLLVAHQTLATASIAAVQLGIGAGLIWRRSVRVALAASVAWALGVWVVGEGLGQLIFPQASMLTGAPGPALVYAVAAVALWPRDPTHAGTAQASTGARWRRVPSGANAALGSWALLWCTTALLELERANWAPDAISAQLHEAASGQPGWLAGLDHGLAAALAGAGIAAAFALVVVEFAVGWGALRPGTRRVALGSGIVVSALLWLTGQGLGGMLTGRATDVGLGPAMVVLALALWPSPAPPSSADTGGEPAEARRAVSVAVSRDEALGDPGGVPPPQHQGGPSLQRPPVTAAGHPTPSSSRPGRDRPGDPGSSPHLQPSGTAPAAPNLERASALPAKVRQP